MHILVWSLSLSLSLSLSVSLSLTNTFHPEGSPGSCWGWTPTTEVESCPLSYIQKKEPRPREVKRLIDTTWQDSKAPNWVPDHRPWTMCIFGHKKNQSPPPQKSTLHLEIGNGAIEVRLPRDHGGPWIAGECPRGAIFRGSLPVVCSTQPSLQIDRKPRLSF